MPGVCLGGKGGWPPSLTSTCLPACPALLSAAPPPITPAAVLLHLLILYVPPLAAMFSVVALG